MTAQTVSWDEVYDSDTGRLELPAGVADLVITGAASPRKPAANGGPTHEGAATVAVGVRIEDLPSELRCLEFMLTDDLLLEVYCDPGLLHCTCRGPIDRWVATTGYPFAQLTVTGARAGALSVRVGNVVRYVVGAVTEVDRLEMVCLDRIPSRIGWVRADELVVRGGSLVVEAVQGGPAAGVWAGRVEVEDGQIINNDRIIVGSVSSRMVIDQAPTASLVLGESMEYASSTDLTVRHGTVEVRHGLVSGLALEDVKELVIGQDETALNDALQSGLSESKASELGYGLAVRVSGSTNSLIVNHRGSIAGDQSEGFRSGLVAALESAEISGLDASSFNLASVKVLANVRRLGLWVPISAHDARVLFEEKVAAVQGTPPPALFDLAHHRKELLALALTTKQDGHVLAVLREAEKDARRASLPLRNRERILLELWRWLLGYGERILWPLVAALPLLFFLGLAEVGWGRFWSRSWWSGWGHLRRYESIMNFALPGVDFLGLSGTGGLWGVLAKAVSVVFVASSLTAAARVVRRGE